MELTTASYTYDEAREALRYSDSYTRMGLIMDLLLSMDETDWLRLLGENWCCCDNIAEFQNALELVLPPHGPVAEMMTAAELHSWHELPEAVTVYRGCGAHNIKGICWSLDRGVAEKFPGLNRYQVAKPLLATATVHREDILAFKQDRDEAEIISFRPRIQKVQKLKQTK
jgi:hypothetical protein